MTDDRIPPAERVFKVPPAGAAANNHDAPSETAKASPSPLGENLWHVWTKGMSWAGKNPAADKMSKPLFASPVRLPGIDSVKQILVGGIDLDAVNKILTGILVLLMVYGIIMAVGKESSIGKLMRGISRVRFEQSGPRAVAAYPPVDDYLGQVRARDIFNPLGEVRTQVMPEPLPPEPPRPGLKEMAGGLSVVGIAWGEDPKAMIQDAAAHEIYFLKKDEMIGKTEIQVKDIRRDKVVISYGEEEMEL